MELCANTHALATYERQIANAERRYNQALNGFHADTEDKLEQIKELVEQIKSSQMHFEETFNCCLEDDFKDMMEEVI